MSILLTQNQTLIVCYKFDSCFLASFSIFPCFLRFCPSIFVHFLLSTLRGLNSSEYSGKCSCICITLELKLVLPSLLHRPLLSHRYKAKYPALHLLYCTYACDLHDSYPIPLSLVFVLGSCFYC